MGGVASKEIQQLLEKTENDFERALKTTTTTHLRWVEEAREAAMDLAKQVDLYRNQVEAQLRRAEKKGSATGVKKVKGKVKEKGLLKSAEESFRRMDRAQKDLERVGRRLGQDMQALGREVKAGSAPKPLYRAIKVLQTGILSTAAKAKYLTQTVESNIRDYGKRWDVQQRTYDSAVLQIEKACRKALACIQVIKSKPTPEVWAEMINRGMGRDVRMALRSLRDAQEKKGMFTDLPDVGYYYDRMLPYDQEKAKSRLPNADGRVIRQEAKTLSRIVKNVAEAYPKGFFN